MRRIAATLAVLAASPAIAAVTPGFAVSSAGSVKLYRGSGLTPVSSLAAAPGASVAFGDVNADGIDDLVAGSGPGAASRVQVRSGKGGVLADFQPYAPAFQGGVRVGAGDVNGDGAADIVTGPGPGGGPRVRLFSGATGGVLNDFFAFDAGFTGGVAVALADAGGDGQVDLVVGTSTGASRVRVLNGATLNPIADFFAFNAPIGVSLATGRYAGEDALFVGAASASARVNVYRLSDFALVNSFIAFGGGYSGGVRLAAGAFPGGRARGFTDALFVAMANGPEVAIFDATDRRAVDPVASFRPFGDDARELDIAATLRSAVPEPATWALMIAGFGLVGWRARLARAAATAPRSAG